MYEYVSGTLTRCSEDQAIVEVGGIGYCLTVPASTADAIRGRSAVKLLTLMRIKDDRVALYGFATAEERAIFRRICTIAGIGAGTAITILSGMPIEEFRRVILEGDARVLQRVKGIGRKTAERLILELKEVFAAGVTPSATAPIGGVEGDAVSALVALGFPVGQALDAVRTALRELPPKPSLEELIKLSSRRS